MIVDQRSLPVAITFHSPIKQERPRSICAGRGRRGLLRNTRAASLAAKINTVVSGETPMSPAEARLKQLPSGMTDAEWSQRVNLAACYRLVALYGWDDLVDTHISARVPGPEHHFLINPYGLMFDEITASSLVKVDLDGNQLTKSDYSINPAGFTIHSAIHEVREDAGCVLHLHTPDGTAVSSCMEGLLPLNQTAQLVTHDLAYHDYEGIALDHDERPRLQKDLGDKNHMLLRNHGTLTVGRSVASAFERMFHLERACTMQVRTRMLGPMAYPVDPTVIDKNTSLLSNPDRQELRSTTLVWPALLRKLDRIDASYKHCNFRDDRIVWPLTSSAL